MHGHVYYIYIEFFSTILWTLFVSLTFLRHNLNGWCRYIAACCSALKRIVRFPITEVNNGLCTRACLYKKMRAIVP